MSEFSEFFVLRQAAVARYDIPAPLAREIGRFLVTWAHFEHYVQAIIWGTLRLSDEEGRLAVRETRITDRLDIIRDLGKFHNFAMDYVLLQDIRQRADKLAGKRHLLAHSIWQKPDDHWRVLVTRGSWPETQLNVTGYPAGADRNFEPEALPITPDDIRGWTAATIALIDDAERLGNKHLPLPLPEKRKQRSGPQNQNRGRKGSKHKSPRQP